MVEFLLGFRTLIYPATLHTVTVADAPRQLLPSNPTRVSWWRTLYNRVSHSGQDLDGERQNFIHPNLLEEPPYWHRPCTETDGIDRTLDDDPPPSSLRLLRSLPQNSHEYNRDHPDVLPLESGHRELPDRNGAVDFYSYTQTGAAILSSRHHEARANKWQEPGLMTIGPSDIHDFPPPVPPKDNSYAAPVPLLNGDPLARKSTHRREPAGQDPFWIMRMASRSPRVHTRPSLPTRAHVNLSQNSLNSAMLRP